MTILFVTDKFPPEPTTVGNIVNTLAIALSKLGHRVSVLTTYAHSRPLAGEIKTEKIGKVTVFRLPRWSPSGFLHTLLTLYNPFLVRDFDKIVAKVNPDIIHFHNIHQSLCFCLLSRAKKVAKGVFLTTHDVMLFNYGKLIGYTSYKVSPWDQLTKFKLTYNPFRNLAIKYYLSFVDRIFPVSHELKKALGQNGIFNCQVIHNGVDLTFWHPKFFPVNENTIFFGGRVSVAKGSLQAIRALKEVVLEIPTARLLVAGDSQSCAPMIKLAQQLGIGEHIQLLGWLDKKQMKAVYQSSNLLISPSLCFDSFPVMNLEAMACGKPVITTVFGGAQEAVIDGKNGFVIDPNDYKLLAKKIILILKDNQLAQEFGRISYQRAQKYFSLTRYVSLHLLYYQEALENKEQH